MYNHVLIWAINGIRDQEDRMDLEMEISEENGLGQEVLERFECRPTVCLQGQKGEEEVICRVLRPLTII
jgi:hypothetical protein